MAQLNDSTNFANITVKTKFDTKYEKKLAPYNYVIEKPGMRFLLTSVKGVFGITPTYSSLIDINDDGSSLKKGMNLEHPDNNDLNGEFFITGKYIGDNQPLTVFPTSGGKRKSRRSRKSRKSRKSSRKSRRSRK